MPPRRRRERTTAPGTPVEGGKWIVVFLIAWGISIIGMARFLDHYDSSEKIASIAALSSSNEKVARESSNQIVIVPEQCAVPDGRLKVFDDIYARSVWTSDLKKMKSPPDFYGDAQWPPKPIRQKSSWHSYSYLIEGYHGHYCEV